MGLPHGTEPFGIEAAPDGILTVRGCGGQTFGLRLSGFGFGHPEFFVILRVLRGLSFSFYAESDFPGAETSMRAVVQRVSRAVVSVNGNIAGEIGMGLLVLLGVGQADTEADAAYLAEKVSGLRIFEDEQGKMNRSVQEVGGSVLAVSQFTLYGDVRRGKRPSFDTAAAPEKARQLYECFVERIRAAGLRCETGRFQETMKVELVNEGPVTILVDSTKAF
jgi:D-tyrosyl-tRNA(Tyr) deacylase